MTDGSHTQTNGGKSLLCHHRVCYDTWRWNAGTFFWSAVINGIVAVPVMTIMMIMTANPTIMGKFPVSGFLKMVGWAATFVMTASVAAMGITASIG